MCFVDCVTGKEERVCSSYVNRVEAVLAASIVRNIIKYTNNKISIGIITPYS